MPKATDVSFVLFVNFVAKLSLVPRVVGHKEHEEHKDPEGGSLPSAQGKKPQGSTHEEGRACHNLFALQLFVLPVGDVSNVSGSSLSPSCCTGHRLSRRS